jgi:hypothetical protein
MPDTDLTHAAPEQGRWSATLSLPPRRKENAKVAKKKAFAILAVSLCVFALKDRGQTPAPFALSLSKCLLRPIE